MTDYNLDYLYNELKKDPAERLRDRAASLRRQAATMRQGVSFHGDHPAIALEREARDLELAAAALDNDKKNG